MLTPMRERALVALVALGSATRLDILRVLASGARTHAEIMTQLARPLGAWHQLSVLVRAGLLEKRRVDQRTVYYRINVTTLTAVIALLEEIRLRAVQAEGGEAA